MLHDPPVIVALDYQDAKSANEFVVKTSPELCKLKVGKELFTSAGPEFVETLVNKGFQVFLDLKFHDIPNTVKKAVIAATKLGVWMVNVHALGGRNMMLSAREGLEVSGSNRPFLIAVSILTSFNENDLRDIGIETTLEDTVRNLGKMAMECQLDGLVCSAQETSILRQTLGPQSLLVTPGIRPSWAASNDQKRIVTPENAMDDGASYLVIGRPITTHANPIEALELINQSLKN